MTGQREIAATWMRGGTSKGLFFDTRALPQGMASDAALRDRVLLRAIGSPDRYGKQIDGLGGATSSTSKVVLVGPASRPDCDVDYLFGAVAIEAPVIDWSGNCGNLSAAVGPFAIACGLVDAPRDGMATVRIWQANIGKRIVAQVPMRDGQVVEEGDFELDGLSFSGAAIRLDFLDPAGGEEGGGGALFPTGRAIDILEVPGAASVEASLVDAGNPTVFVAAADLGLSGTESQGEINANTELLARLEQLRAHAAVRMGLARTAQKATESRPATPKLAWVAPPVDHRVAGGRRVAAHEIDLVARILSMGKLHHAMTGTGAVAIAAAAAVPGTVVSRIAPAKADGSVRFGHASGAIEVGAQAERAPEGHWRIRRVSLSRSARRLMVGAVCVPAACFEAAPANSTNKEQ
ncbi:2-methylaconitate cis-trans isomerase PrpF [Variovorax paradoxus]|uniref:2-methylaconitate cis-trans isomerase PrpF n=1 Tax=Variovorax paradoxus TaxID=34073 RepID=UPI001934015F|nr:2-methylaconitate cis-trans isomerase PrpF [Variovorax paradoxus]